jgi:hypothetical protein
VVYFGGPPLAGDYNGDHIVDATDYVVWRRAMAYGGVLLNETASFGVVNEADYIAWRNNFGGTSGGGSGVAGPDSVPEPTAGAVFLMATLAALFRNCRRLNCRRLNRGYRRLRVFGSFLQE